MIALRACLKETMQNSEQESWAARLNNNQQVEQSPEWEERTCGRIAQRGSASGAARQNGVVRQCEWLSAAVRMAQRGRMECGIS